MSENKNETTDAMTKIGTIATIGAVAGTGLAATVGLPIFITGAAAAGIGLTIASIAE